MKTKIDEQKTKKIDADGKVLGRLASFVSQKLRGKDNVNFSYNQLLPNKIIVYNVEKITVTGQKKKQKKYYRHSGYLGNLKTISFEKMFSENPKKVFKLAVKGMLPKNRLQKKYLKNLIIYNGEINVK